MHQTKTVHMLNIFCKRWKKPDDVIRCLSGETGLNLADSLHSEILHSQIKGLAENRASGFELLMKASQASSKHPTVTYVL